MWDTLLVLEEVNHPLMCCFKCDMFVPCMALNRKHRATEMCTKGKEHKLKNIREEKAQARTAVFQAYRRPLLIVTELKYLGWFLTTYDD